MLNIGVWYTLEGQTRVTGCGRLCERGHVLRKGSEGVGCVVGFSW